MDCRLPKGKFFNLEVDLTYGVYNYFHLELQSRFQCYLQWVFYPYVGFAASAINHHRNPLRGHSSSARPIFYPPISVPSLIKTSSSFPMLHNSVHCLTIFSSTTAKVLDLSAIGDMAAATACASTALAGQSLLKQSNELARRVGTSEARVTMRKTASKSAGSDSIWWDSLLWVRSILTWVEQHGGIL